jgi:hypothetical protein
MESLIFSAGGKMSSSDTPQACRSFLTKWQAAFEDAGFDAEDTTWEDLMGNQTYGVATLVAANSGGRINPTIEVVTAAINAIFRSRDYQEVLDPNEAYFLIALFQRLGVAIPDGVPISCENLSLIASTPVEQLPAVISGLEQGNDSDSDSEGDEASSSSGSPAGIIALPPPTGGFQPTGTYAPPAAVNPFTIPSGVGAASRPFATPGGSAFPTPATQPPAPGTFVFPGGTQLPPPGTMPPSVAPAGQFPPLGQQPTGQLPPPSFPAPGGSLFPPAGQQPAGQLPPPSFAAPGSSLFPPAGQQQQTQQPPKELSYTTIAVRGLRNTAESKLLLVKIPYPENPSDFITVEIFMTAGPAPKVVTITKFADDDHSTAANQQKSVIHSQNAKTILGSNVMPTELSNGASDKGVCAQRIELYMASPMVKDPESGQEMPFPIPNSGCKPESGKVMSISQIASGGFLPSVTGAPTSGGQPGFQPPPGQQSVVEAAQDEPIPANAVRVQIWTFADNPQLQPLLSTYQLPTGPRLLAHGAGWYWFDLPGGQIGRTKTKFPGPAEKFNKAPGANQKAIFNQIRMLAAAKFGPGYATIQPGGTTAVGPAYVAPRPMTIVGAPLPPPSGGIGTLMGQRPAAPVPMQYSYQQQPPLTFGQGQTQLAQPGFQPPPSAFGQQPPPPTFGQQPPSQMFGQQAPAQQTSGGFSSLADILRAQNPVTMVQPAPQLGQQAGPGLQQVTPGGGAPGLPGNPGIVAIDVNKPYVQNVQPPAAPQQSYIALPPPPAL